jgi:hypothetical protein
MNYQCLGRFFDSWQSTLQVVAVANWDAGYPMDSSRTTLSTTPVAYEIDGEAVPSKLKVGSARMPIMVL